MLLYSFTLITLLFYSNSNSDTLIYVIFPSDKSNSIRELFSSKDLQTSSTVVQSDASIVNVTFSF